MNKNRIFQVIKEEIKLFSEENQLSVSDMSGIFDKLMKKLASIDLSLNMIYGTLAGRDPSVTGARLGAMGRFAKAMPSLASKRETRD